MQVCKAATGSLKASLQLGAPADYAYLKGGDCMDVDGVDDVHDFKVALLS